MAICTSGAHGLEQLTWNYPGSTLNDDYNKLFSNDILCDILDYTADAAFPNVTSTGAIIKQIQILSADDPSKFTVTWTASGSSFYANIRHYMGTVYPYALTIWDKTTKEIVEPLSIEFLSSMELRIWSLTNDDVVLVISNAPTSTTRARRYYYNTGCSDLSDFLAEIENIFIYSSSSSSSVSFSSSSVSSSSSSVSSSSVSFSSSSCSWSSSSVSSSSSSVSSSSSSSSSLSSSSSSSSVSSSSSSSSSLSSSSSSSLSSSSSSSSSSVSSSSSSSSSSSVSSSSSSSTSSSSISSSSISTSSSSSSFSCFITPNDDFDQADGTEPDVQRWEKQGAETMIISGGALRGTVDAINNYDGVISRFRVKEVFDAQIDYNIVSGGDVGVNGWNLGMKIMTQNEEVGLDIVNRGYQTTYTEYVISGGVRTDNTNIATTDTSGAIRITRDGSQLWQSYYWNGVTWVSIGSTTSLVDVDQWAEIFIYVENFNLYPGAIVDFDNFVVTGSISCPNSSSSSSISSSSSSSISSSSISFSSSSVSISSSSSSSSISLIFSSSSSSSLSSSSSSSSLSSSSSISSSSSSSESGTPWLGTWANRREITIDSTKVDENLTDFPVALSLTNSAGLSATDITNIFTELTSASKKIAVTSSDAITQLYVEIENWDSPGNKGMLHTKVSAVPSGSNTSLYLYYDSLQPDNTTYVGDTTTSAAQAVWDDSFKGVWHMSQDPSTGANSLKDSTSNINNGSPEGAMGSGNLVDGLNGAKAIQLDKVSTDMFDCGDDTSLDIIDEITLEAIAKTDDDVLNQALIGRFSTDGSNDNFLLFAAGGVSSQIQTIIKSSGTSYTAASSNNELTTNWRHYVGVYNKVDVRIYIDGILSGTPVANTNQIDNDNVSLVIGGRNQPGNDIQFDGNIGETRISATDRSVAWVKATYSTLFDILLTWGAEEEL